METHATWQPNQLRDFQKWLHNTDYITRPQSTPHDEPVFIQEDVCRAYLDRDKEEEAKRFAPVIEYVGKQRCTRCGKLKSATDFYLDGKGHRRTICRQCAVEAQKVYNSRVKPKHNKKMEEQKTKKCKVCGKVLPLDAFNKHSRTADVYASHCRECHSTIIKRGVSHRRGGVTAEPKEEEVRHLTPELIENMVEPVVHRGAEIVAEPMAIIESPHWIGLIPDDELYAELLRRGWEGSMTKTLKKAQ